MSDLKSRCVLVDDDDPMVRSVVNATKVAIKPSDETVAWMQKKWEMIVTPKTGCKDYGEMLATYKSEQTASS